MQPTLFNLTDDAIPRPKGLIVGIDEVGRGPLAGPVMAAAAVLKTDTPQGLDDVTDSKKLTAAKREELMAAILEQCHIGIGEATVEEIDKMNIRQATHLAMCRALQGLEIQPDFAFVDGNDLPQKLGLKAQTVIKGDSKGLEIACVSIVAKVTRDHKMNELHHNFPHYFWNTNVGYGTKQHIESIAEFGVTIHHRRSFKPVSDYL